jgi:hypothetical protein
LFRSNERLIAFCSNDFIHMFVHIMSENKILNTKKRNDVIILFL